jgi:hypothetical protein
LPLSDTSLAAFGTPLSESSCPSIRRLFLFTLFLLIVGSAPEPPLSQNLTVRVHAGGAFAAFQGDTDDFNRRIQGVVGSGNTDVGRRAALRTGVFLEIPLTDVVSLRPEIVYAQKGATLEARGTRAIAPDFRHNPRIQSVHSEGDFDVRNDVLSVGVSYRFDL